MTNKLPLWLKNKSSANLLAGTVVLLFIFAGFFFIQKVIATKTHYSLDQFQPAKHPLLEEDRRIRTRFHIHESSPVVVVLKAQGQATWLHPTYLKELKSLTRSVASFDEVASVKSLANIETAITDQQSFTVGTIEDLSKSAENRQKILHDPLLTPHLVSTDGKLATLIILTNRLSFKQQSDFLKNLTDLTKKNSHLYSASISGVTAISNQIATLLQDEIVKCSLISLLLSALILFALFKNISMVFLGLILVTSANIFALGTLSWMEIPLTVLSSTTPIIITLIVIALTTQTLSRIASLRNKVLPKHKHLLVFRVLREISSAHVLAASATAIGFASLMESETPIIKSYGMSVSISVLVTCAVTLALMSALLVWLPLPQKRTYPITPDMAIRFISRQRAALFSSLVLLGVLFAVMGQRLNWTARLFDDLSENHPIRQDLNVMQDQLGGALPLDLSIGKKGQPDAWKNPQNVKRLEDLVTTWRKQPGVGSVMALTDFLKATNSQGLLPQTQPALSETYFIFSMANENPLATVLSSDGAFTRIGLRMKDLPASELQALVTEIKTQAQISFPDFQIEMAGMSATVHPINEDLSRHLIYGFYSAILWIMALMMLVFRSVRWVVVAAAPNLMPPAILMGALALAQTPIKPSIAIIFAISLGIAFNNTVYLFTKIRKMLAKNPGELCVDELLREELGPCFMSGCAMMAGFAVFLFSQLAMNQIFGAFMILSIVAGLLGDLVILPTLLYMCPRLLLRDSIGAKLVPTVRLNIMNPSLQKIAIFMLLLGLGLISQTTFASAPNVQDILKKIEKTNMSPYEQVEIKMKIHEPDGAVKERVLSIKKKSDKEQKAMVKLISPTDLKGVGLLTVSSGKGEEDQWLYLPSEKRSRRIVGSNKKGRFLDSELNYEDLRASTYSQFQNKIIENKKDGNQHEIAVIESKAKPDSESSYSKIKTWVDISDYKILKSEYYGDDGKLLKIMTFNDYKKYKNLWRAQNISVKNVKKNRSTTLELKKFSQKKIDDGEFSMSALEEG